ncbi:hypothetical protein [Phenylobacterium soli]|uniref:Uncharacterized protein n=1 Tax=Phenylobacterium soli TaxID=2170551 RepID=A0A328AAY8_9CAUL|nr:hypothetical protein [Phenylobacterium soli]RAK51617.1 hypothetical protein DJ017_17430 [Phenylobacterium soli]
MAERETVLDAFDAGLLNDFGGGDVGWWQDYIRSLLGQAHDHYAQQAAALLAERRELRTALENIRDNSNGWQRDAAHDPLSTTEEKP